MRDHAIVPTGAIVEWWRPFSSYRLGIVSNLPEQRHAGRVHGVTDDGRFLLVQHVDSVAGDNLARVEPDLVTILAETSEAGWARLARRTTDHHSNT